MRFLDALPCLIQLRAHDFEHVAHLACRLLRGGDGAFDVLDNLEVAYALIYIRKGLSLQSRFVCG